MIIVLMGVTGCGKTSVGSMLATELGWTFYDADDFHPPANVEKMRIGEPLNDSDRLPWLEKLRATLVSALNSGVDAVVACSALKAAYRKYLLIDDRVRLVHLSGTRELIRLRLAERRGHYMNPGLVDSQFAILEEPEQALKIDIDNPLTEIVRQIRSSLGI